MGLEMPEAHGEVLDQPAAGRSVRRGGHDQVGDDQRNDRHAGIDQGIDAVEDDCIGAGQEAEDDACCRHEDRHDDRDSEDAPFWWSFFDSPA